MDIYSLKLPASGAGNWDKTQNMACKEQLAGDLKGQHFIGFFSPF